MQHVTVAKFFIWAILVLRNGYLCTMPMVHAFGLSGIRWGRRNMLTNFAYEDENIPYAS